MLLQASSKDGSRPSSSNTLPEPDDRALEEVANNPFASSSEGRTHLDRIAELEKAMAIAHSEQQVMAKEIKKLQQHELVYRDAMETYKQQLSDSNDHRYMPDSNGPLKEFEEETDRYRFWSKERSELQEEVFDLKDKLEELQSETLDREGIWSAQWEHERANWIKERNQQAEALHNAEKEVLERRKQLIDLKQSISALTRTDNQATDSDLLDRMDQLYHRIREWVISNYRRSKLGVSNLNPDTIAVLEAINPKYQQSETTDKISLYQAVVAFNAMKIFQENVCVGLPISGVLAETCRLFQGRFIQGYQPYVRLTPKIDSDGPDFRNWSRATVRMIRQTPLKDAVDARKKELIHSVAETTLKILEDISGVTKSDAIESSLVNLLYAAGDLQDTLLFQKARYSISFLVYDVESSHLRFDSQKMDPINELEEDDGEFLEPEFRYAVFPNLIKSGDELGARPEIRNVLLRARVVCGKGR
jgi:hypothetical protein